MSTRLVAEVGSNHDGDLQRAFDLMLLAKQSGATDVKFQMFKASELAAHRKLSKDAQEVLKANELPTSWLPLLAGYAMDTGLGFACTAYDEWGLTTVAPYVDWFKVASYELTDHRFLREHHAYPQQVVLSTGMANAYEVAQAVQVLNAHKLKALLHCVTAYPCPAREMDLRVVPALLRDYPTIPIGLSDHTEGIGCSIGAVAVGATFIERHFTDDRTRSGPDHRFALEPGDFALMAQCIADVEQTLGQGGLKLPRSIEQPEQAHRVIST